VSLSPETLPERLAAWWRRTVWEEPLRRTSPLPAVGRALLRAWGEALRSFESATLHHEAFSDPGWLFERKLDGVRCIVFRKGSSVRLVSRRHEAMNDTWPELVGEVGFREWTRDGKLRHPRFVGLRTDKDAKDVHRQRARAAPE
jgi:ATP-dependent DNA ligase